MKELPFEQKLAAILRFGELSSRKDNGKFQFKPIKGYGALLGLEPGIILVNYDIILLVDDVFYLLTAVTGEKV